MNAQIIKSKSPSARYILKMFVIGFFVGYGIYHFIEMIINKLNFQL